MAMSSISKACLEISNSIKGFRTNRSSSPTPDLTSPSVASINAASASSYRSKHAVATAPVVTLNAITRVLKSATNRVKSVQLQNGHHANSELQESRTYQRSLAECAPQQEKGASRGEQPTRVERRLPTIWENEKFLMKFFWYFSPKERALLAQVCTRWRNCLNRPTFWTGIRPIINCKELNRNEISRGSYYETLQKRECDSICLFCVTDADIADFLIAFAAPSARSRVRHLIVRYANVTDAGLESLLNRLTSVTQLELAGCNEVTESGFWSFLNARMTCLSISDCINMADDSIGAIAQLLPSLIELNIQAYHVTDASLAFFCPKQSYSLSVLRLQSCWEITNQGVLNLVHSLPNLNVLSLSGCSKVTDEGVELIAENLRKLRSLDLSWCPRVTDTGMEYIACDMAQLQELTLDRCPHISDIGIGYLSTMTLLSHLFLRWCRQLTDAGLQRLCTVRSLRVLSVAGCHLVTSNGLLGLVHLANSLEELEMTNCDGATQEVANYLEQNMPKCLIIE